MSLWRNQERNCSKECIQLERMLNRLVCVRNKILKSLKDIELFREEYSGGMYPFMKKDILSMLGAMMPKVDKGVLKRNILWKLDSKPEDKEMCSEEELSE